MCNGIAVLVYEKNGEIKGLCTGISSHDELCKLDDALRYGEIEPYRFELLYPYNLTYDRSAKNRLGGGIAKEQPPEIVWDVARSVSNFYNMRHTIKQLQNAYLVGANLHGANLTGANLHDADLYGVIK